MVTAESDEMTLPDGWPIQAWCWLEWGKFRTSFRLLSKQKRLPLAQVAGYAERS
jgi:hypothetical protein